MTKYQEFILEDFPKDAVVNSAASTVNINKNVDNFINNAVSQHLNSIIDNPNKEENEIIENPSSDKLKENIDIDNKNDRDKIDIEKIKKEAYKKGEADAKAKYHSLLKQSSIKKNFSNLLEEKLSSILLEQNLDKEISQISAKSISAIAKKLYLVLPANFEEIIINGLIAKLKKFYKEGEITITIHPDRYDLCKEILQSNSIPEKFKNNFHIVKDSRINLDDCSLKWENTKLEYNQKQLSEEIDKIIEQLKTANYAK